LKTENPFRNQALVNRHYSYTRAGQYLDSGAAYTGKFTSSGIFGSLKRRWGGWSCSWFVLLLWTN